MVESLGRGLLWCLTAVWVDLKGSSTWKGFLMNAAYDQREIPVPGNETQFFCLREYKEIRGYLLSQNSLVKDYDDLK